MLSLQEISDRMEIQQLMVDYSEAIDRKDYDALDQVFTPDAYIDYRAMGGIDGPYPVVKAWLSGALANFPHHQHILGNISIKVAGDTATSRAICFNPMDMALPDGKRQVMFFGLWYVDAFVRTPGGWRMNRRVEERCYDFNVPEGVGSGS
ncbi:nuclear transport factor 2 family protein [Denitratisoma oestradiolicum]|uniref:Uncharacterized protein n=1 Tax=Denitratisoma oestradiolicum TaxID=311182 RepID=A0A6S6XRU4_9PROT|nr:nuclear transport factor 2 family protein [Denitratisoma oestradiolicum]TWO81490.1 hypothetical protein CBW56_05125 [Denitratisoma oestradiolicum]CAB1368701.1 conserved protein of unknown function [Denitratisoma oestradiolicum]